MKLRHPCDEVSYWEENHRHSQGDGHQHSQAHTEDQDIQGVHFAVGVQQLWLHITYATETHTHLTYHSWSTPTFTKLEHAYGLRAQVGHSSENPAHSRHRNRMTIESLEALTVKGEVAKQSCEQVHDEHGQDGDVGNILHAFLGGAGVKTSRKNNHTQLFFFFGNARTCRWGFVLTRVVQCRWEGPQDGRQMQKPEWG